MIFLLFTKSNGEHQVTMAWNAIFFYKFGKKNLKIGPSSNIDVLKEGGIRLYNRKNKKYPDFSQDNKNILTSRILGK